MKLREINAADAPPAPTYAQAVEVTGATRFGCSSAARSR